MTLWNARGTRFGVDRLAARDPGVLMRRIVFHRVNGTIILDFGGSQTRIGTLELGRPLW